MLIHENCKNYLPSIKENSIDLILIDPPYLLTKCDWDKEEQVDDFLISQLTRILKPTGNLYIWCGMGEKDQSLVRWFPILKKQLYFKDIITWKKQRGMGMRKGWLYTREEILWFVKDNKKFIWNIEHQYGTQKRTFTATYKDPERMAKYKKAVKSEFKRLTNVWDDIREANISWNNKEIESIHYTPKPLAAMERIIKAHTKEGDLVLDCFAGTGTTGVACQNLNRNYILIEKDIKSIEICKERLGIK